MQATGLVARTVRPEPLRAVPPATKRRIDEGLVVSLHYTLTLDDGNVVESTLGGAPLQYLHGAGNVVPGLERELRNRTVGDRLSVDVAPRDGYGEDNPAMVKRISRKEFPSDARFEPGMRFGSQLDDGTILPAWVVDVGKKNLTVSFNHPLAGQHLHFVVEVVGIRDARTDELSHGRPNGLNGFRR